MTCRRALALLVAFALTGCMLSDITWRERRQQKKRAEATAVTKVDMGIVLHVVRQDPGGSVIVPDAPKLTIVRTHRRGRMVDIDKDGARWSQDASRNPAVWYCSEGQEPLILHPDDAALWQLIQGSEGSGKTVCLAMWAAFRALEHIGTDHEIGVTAPTGKRLAHLKREIRRYWKKQWYRWRARDEVYVFHAGPRVQMVSAHQQSEDEGSPIQGFNWVAHCGDELQDHYEKEDDIIARGRSAPGGQYKRLNSSTFKDSPGWRTFRTGCIENSRWNLTKLLGTSSPFVDPEHWENARAGMSAREYQRRVLAMDVGPERQVYHGWSRTIEINGKQQPGNLRAIPDVGATDITARVLGGVGRNFAVLGGHDPGARQDVTLLLRAFEFANARLPTGERDARPRWFVVDEITTEGETHEVHVERVLKRVRQSDLACNQLDRTGRPVVDGNRLLVRIDPHTPSGDAHPGKDLYAIWANRGVAVKAAAYKTAGGVSAPTGIKPESRIDLLNALFCDATIERDEETGQIIKDGCRRLFVAFKPDGSIAAPRLVEALETMERDGLNRAEWERKDGRDKSHWPAALAYSVWSLEHERMGRAA